MEFRRPLLSLNTLISCNEDEDFMRRVGAPSALNLLVLNPPKKLVEEHAKSIEHGGEVVLK